MLLTEKEARTICEKLLSYVKADDAVATVPEVGRARLISDIPEQPRFLSILNLPEDLPAKLEVVALLVNRE